MKKAAFTNSFVSSAAKASAIFGVDYQRGKSGTPQKRMERRWLNETAQKRAACQGTSGPQVQYLHSQPRKTVLQIERCPCGMDQRRLGS